MKLNWILVPLLAASFALAQSGNDVLQQGLRKERSEGDYKGAIEIYKRILKQYPSDRKLAATALLQIAHCQEREGSKDARSSYERLVREYGDQTQAVNEARARITALETGPSSAPRVRQLWAGEDVDGSGSLSSDGRWLTYANWETGDLGVRDLVNGTNKLLTNTGGWARSGGDFAQDSRFSPDGKKIAYNWFSPKSTYDLRVMNADGTGVRSLGWTKTGYIVPMCWNPDGAQILANFYGSDGLTSLYLVNATSGESREILPPAARRNISGASFSPDGKWIVMDGQGADDLQEADLYIMAAAGGLPEKLESNPSNDIRPVWSQDGSSILFVSNRGGAYGLWRLPVRNGKAGGPAQLIRGELGNRVDPVGVTRAGSLVYTVNYGGVDAYIADFDPITAKRTSEPTLISQRYPGSSMRPQVSPDGRFIAYLAQTGSSASSGGWVVVVRDQTTGKEKVHPAVRSNHLGWTPDSKQLVLGKPGEKPNSMELLWLDPDSGAMTPFRTFEPTRNGINPVFSSDGRTMYFTYRPWQGDNSIYQVIAMDVATGQQRELYRSTNQFLFGLALSADGRTLATILQEAAWNTRGEQDYELVLVPVAGGQARVATTFRAARASVTGSFTPDGKRVLILRESATPLGSPSALATQDVASIELATGKLELVNLQRSPLTTVTLDSSSTQLLFTAGQRKSEMWIAENILAGK
ncbi:MAG TPA: tetratricopeptide repeat protein [Bryobacteraceae bacterium]|nr:tetratricopeptide repeat protein [Bryobacteraceae bacterium]